MQRELTQAICLSKWRIPNYNVQE